jgi:hypothetical protein
MVGAKPTFWPLARSALSQCRRSATFLKMSMEQEGDFAGAKIESFSKLARIASLDLIFAQKV